MESENTKVKESGLKRRVLLLTILVCLLVGWILVDKLVFSVGKSQPSQDEFVENAQDKLDSVSEQLNLRLIQIKKLGGKVNELETAQAQIVGDQAHLEDIDPAEFQKKISFYVHLLGLKDAEIKKLTKENVTLTQRNDSLSREAQNLKVGLVTIQKALKDSSKTFGLKARELSERSRVLEIKNKELADKVSAAAALRAEGVNVYAISSRGKESTVNNQKAKKVDKIRVMFHLQENTLASKEIKTIFLRIIEPTGSTISDYNLGSGSFEFKGRDLTFTSRQRIFYENNHQSVEFIYTRPNGFKNGKHEIELYAEGYLIGLGTFEVR
jgi:DNA gyrase/topoisomerase IV subunit A